MKGILNVLYRRILYKIPLKFLLLLLGIGAILFASCNAVDMDGYTDIIEIPRGGSNAYFTVGDTLKCFATVPGYNTNGFAVEDSNHTRLTTFIGDYNNGIFFCIGKPGTYSFYATQNSYGGETYVYVFDYPFTQSDCELTYNLIPISAVDSNYCETNNLCSVYTGGGNSSGLNWSSLYINNIQHLGGPNIYINIPEELSRDYDYTDEDMYIDIEGYNVDYDKITGIINTQNYKPTNEDFNYIVFSIIPLFVPGLVIILFLYWIFRFIKKIF